MLFISKSIAVTAILLASTFAAPLPATEYNPGLVSRSSFKPPKPIRSNTAAPNSALPPTVDGKTQGPVTVKRRVATRIPNRRAATLPLPQTHDPATLGPKAGDRKLSLQLPVDASKRQSNLSLKQEKAPIKRNSLPVPPLAATGPPPLPIHDPKTLVTSGGTSTDKPKSEDRRLPLQPVDASKKQSSLGLEQKANKRNSSPVPLAPTKKGTTPSGKTESPGSLSQKSQSSGGSKPLSQEYLSADGRIAEYKPQLTPSLSSDVEARDLISRLRVKSSYSRRGLVDMD